MNIALVPSLGLQEILIEIAAMGRALDELQAKVNAPPAPPPRGHKPRLVWSRELETFRLRGC